MIIPNSNIIPPSDIDKDLVESLHTFSRSHSDLLLSHITHQMNDLNTASTRICKLREFIKEYESTSFGNNGTTDHYAYNTFELVVVIMFIIVFVTWKFGIFKCMQTSINRRERRRIALAIGEDQNEEGIVLTTTEQEKKSKGM